MQHLFIVLCAAAAVVVAVPQQTRLTKFENTTLFASDQRIVYQPICAEEQPANCRGSWSKYQDERFPNGVAMVAGDVPTGALDPYMALTFQGSVLLARHYLTLLNNISICRKCFLYVCNP
jgi:hypothetical protein